MPDEASAGPSAEQILAALENTGFLLEYRVAQKLQELGFYAYMNHPFVDPDSGKTREIDVLAEIYDNIKNGDLAEILVHASLLVECKNYKDPLLLIGEPATTIFHNEKPIITFDPLQFDFPRRPGSSQLGIRFELRLGDLPSYCTQGFIGSQLLKMHRNRGVWQASNDAVYDSIVYPLAKADEYEKAWRGGEDLDEKPWDLPAFTSNFAVLVTSSDLFAVEMFPNRTPEVRQVGWAPLVRYFSESTFVVDVVTFSSLEEYVQSRIVPTLQETKDAIVNKMQFFNPEWLQNEFGEAPESEFGEWLHSFRAERDATAE
jgi:hypothetical protein